MNGIRRKRLAALFFSMLCLLLYIVNKSEAAGSLFTEAQKNEVLQTHNIARRQFGIPEITWNPLLATVAQDFANKCVWKHNDKRTYEYSLLSFSMSASVGENLAAATSGRQSVTTMINMWSAESANWRYPNQCASGKVCGHYTQMIWSGTKQVGCGMARCQSLAGSGISNADFLVCDYTPAGNIVGRAPY